ncbi:hypothetical protein HDIA_2227 [Hartmannibacter diazotrophicus]|uniref:Uncharacterized protein n=1 Tax=Hartmannibacter diazotrophicus TaxID=1482074 RepID=A0A2C9D6J8_9HYPH|nr:hypothetical protein [Hartmannibacter diazotrophicus]SON55768.1 hypothetical protein HDIA_2227 [Hartmannibacter diazotrophicus]
MDARDRLDDLEKRIAGLESMAREIDLPLIVYYLALARDEIREQRARQAAPGKPPPRR